MLALPCVRRPAALEWEFLGWINPPPCNSVGTMHALLVQHTECDKNPLSTNYWSHRVRRSELPLPCVRRPGAWEWDFQLDQAPPLQLAAWGACMRFWCKILSVA